VRRRTFIAGLGNAVAWPLVGRAQQPAEIRRLGILWPHDENDPTTKEWYLALITGLAELGWAEGRNLRIDVRSNPRTSEPAQGFAKELVDLRPDVLVTGTARLVRAVQMETQTIPIILVGAGDPLALGLVKSLSRPEGNTTGITDIFPSIAGKWLEIMRECVPGLVKVALIFNPNILRSSAAFEAAVQAGAKHGVQVIKTPVQNTQDIEHAVAAFAAEPARSDSLAACPSSSRTPTAQSLGSTLPIASNLSGQELRR
jgi:putative tryptophan/tyrosine transport system substrate-binding protein